MAGNVSSEKPFLKLVDRVFSTIDIVIYGLMICVVLMQVFARIALPKVPPWTEEVSRYLQIYLVAFGAGLAIKYNAFVNIETIFGLLNKKNGLIVKIVDEIINFAMFIFIFIASFDFYKLGIPKSAISMPALTMNVIYFSMILMSGSSLFYIVRKVFGLVREYRMEGKRSC